MKHLNKTKTVKSMSIVVAIVVLKFMLDGLMIYFFDKTLSEMIATWLRTF